MRKHFVPFSLLLFLSSLSYATDSYTQLISGYKDGFYVKTPDDRFSLKFGSRINFGYTYGILKNAENLSSFDIQHAKFYFGGNAYGTTVQYYVQAAAANNTRNVGLGPVSESPNQGFTLEDYYIRLQYSGIDLKFGQYKVPFGRQWMIYSGNLDFVDRSIVTQAFLFGRDRGVTFSRYSDKFALSLGAFNGAGTIQAGNPFQLQTGQNQSNDSINQGFLYVSRVTYSPLGQVGYSEGDVEQTEGHRLELGGGFAYDQHRDYDLNLNQITDDRDVNSISASGDLTWKSEGFSLQGEYFYRRHQPSVNAHFTAIGFYVQPAYFIIPRKLEAALRFSKLDPDTSLGQNQLMEGAASLNYYFSSDHRFKTKFQYTLLNQDHPTGQTNDHFIDVSFQVTL